MFLSDLSKIVFAFAFGVVLSAFSSGLLLLPLFMIAYLIFDFSINNGKFEYCYMEHRASIIYYGFLGFILGRTLHNMCVSPIFISHKKEQTKKLNKIPAVIINLYNDLKFIKSIKSSEIFNLNDRRKVENNEIYYYFYRKLINESYDDIINFIQKIYNDSIKCLDIYKNNKYIYNIIYYRLKKSRDGIKNISIKYPDTKDKLDIIINNISQL